MKQQLNIIDLDKTLLKVDSLRLFYVWVAKKNLLILFWFLLRTLRILSSKKLKLKIYTETQNISPNQLDEFINSLDKYIDDKVIQHINNNTQPNSKTIILSASFHFYVAPFSQKIGYTGFGSQLSDNTFFHLYANNKIDFLRKNFPDNQYQYNYAISDHSSDIPLLKLFKNSFLVKSINQQTEITPIKQVQ